MKVFFFVYFRQNINTKKGSLFFKNQLSIIYIPPKVRTFKTEILLTKLVVKT